MIRQDGLASVPITLEALPRSAAPGRRSPGSVALRQCVSGPLRQHSWPYAWARWVFPLWKTFHNGKTHLARAYARECCERGMQSYYIKARELRDKLASSVRSGGGGCATGTLARANCLVIDEIGRCVSGRERAELLFHIVDRRCEREGPNTTILTSNFGADRWGEFLAGGPTLLCTLDRIFDNATALVARGPSFRGAGLRTYAAGTAPVAARTQPGIPQARQGGLGGQGQGN